MSSGGEGGREPPADDLTPQTEAMQIPVEGLFPFLVMAVLGIGEVCATFLAPVGCVGGRRGWSSY